jgi:hypothetical protein
MDDLERILSSPDDLEPSAGFVDAVLAAIERDAAPPTLPFPWLRFAVGVAACLVMALTGAILVARLGAAATAWLEGLRPLTPVALYLGYAALSVALSFALTRLPRLFVSR